MGLYDSVDRGKPKPKRLTGPIALCCALFLLFGGLTYWACHYQFRFHAFISDLTDSTRDARSTETFRVTVNGSETDVSIDDLSDLLYLIDKAGAGRTAAAPEEMPYAVIDYGDGSTLEIWKVELVNPSNDWTEGRRRSYQLTAEGETLLQNEVERLQAQVRDYEKLFER